MSEATDGLFTSTEPVDARKLKHVIKQGVSQMSTTAVTITPTTVRGIAPRIYLLMNSVQGVVCVGTQRGGRHKESSQEACGNLTSRITSTRLRSDTLHNIPAVKWLQRIFRLLAVHGEALVDWKFGMSAE